MGYSTLTNSHSNDKMSSNKPHEIGKEAALPVDMSQQNAVIMQYQQIIRDQDLKLREQYQENQDLVHTCTQLQENCRNISSILNQKNVESEYFSSEKLNMQAKINELENKVNLLEEKLANNVMARREVIIILIFSLTLLDVRTRKTN